MQTLAGTIMGTPQFMAPEQARGEIERIDARSDIYSLGAILYQILALRVSVTGTDAMEVVGKVGRGEIEPVERGAPSRVSSPIATPQGRTPRSARGETRSTSHLPGGVIPDSLAAVVRKAMALDRAARYPAVADLQRDIEAYQGGFATSAENAGAWKQFTLLVKRHKAASIGVAAVLVLSIGFMAKVIAEGRRAERGEAKANSALADLKASAPALLQLAESEADSQRFASALGKLDAALALDPALHRARWQRAWVLLALERWSEAADALRLARQNDPAGAQLASILPAVERMAASNGDPAGLSKADATLLLRHLQTVGASGAIIALTQKLGMSGDEKMKLVQQRVKSWLGPSAGWLVHFTTGNYLKLDFFKPSFTTIAPLKGLPIEALDISGAKVDSLEPLRGMPLTKLYVENTGISDLSPLAGMSLIYFNAMGCPITDFTALRDAPLRSLKAADTRLHDLSFLADAPIVELLIARTPVEDLSVLKGKPLQILDISATRVRDLSPLIGAPLEELVIPYIPPRFDLSILLKFSHLERLGISNDSINLESLRHHPSLKFIQRYGNAGAIGDARPAAEFWAEYDAKQAVQKK